MKKKSIISFILSICMIFTMVPMQALNVNADSRVTVPVEQTVEEKDDVIIHEEYKNVEEENDMTKNQDTNNNNNVSEPEEKWVYEPVMDTSADRGISLLSEGYSTINVTVNAVDKNTNEIVPVSGADVKLYSGTDYIRSATTKSDGVATLDLSGLTLEQKLDATVAASKVVAQDKGISGSGRDALFNSFPHDSNGNYIRYNYELHSEKIDKNGNWVGKKMPFTLENEKVDIAFAIDATGSMSDEINSVKNNITSFAEKLINKGLDVRFSIIEYRDITESGEETILHIYNGSNWYNRVADVVNVLDKIRATGGGDNPETVIDALGMAASDKMRWRSGAAKFAFLLTDADYKNDNNYGYTSMDQLITDLKRQKIMTSVITTSSYKSRYQSLYESTGGIYASIASSTFAVEMEKLADSVATSAAGDMTLTLKEPRLKYNLSTCYLANDDTSRSRDYYNNMKRMLNEFANDIAETSDGHVMIDKMILFSTDNRLNFYDISNKASMADIQIQTRESDVGKGDNNEVTNLQVHSNAYTGGFYSDNTVDSDVSVGKFDHLIDRDKYIGRKIFYRIQLSGKEGADWDNSFDDDYELYATTVTHEAAHYLFSFFDEYLNQNEIKWSYVGYKPYPAFGLMDNQHEDIEMSKKNIDYSYFGGNIPTDADTRHTLHSYVHHQSCEERLASLLINGDTYFTGFRDIEVGPYKVTYTYDSKKTDRTATYSSAKILDANFISVTGTGINTLADTDKDTSYFENMAESYDSFGDISFTGMDGKVVCTFLPEVSANYSIYLRKSGQSAFSEIAMTLSDGQYTANLPVNYNEMAELYLVKLSDDVETYKYYTLDHSANSDFGYIFNTAANTVYGYVSNSEQTAYTIVDDRSKYTNDNYISVNDAIIINDDVAGSTTDGEIYSVASKDATINYKSISWFLYKNGVWTQLDTDLSNEENNNVGARADMKGSGTYVLMAKIPSTEKAAAVTDLSYTQDSDTDSLVTLHFNDPNTETRQYNVYYSESEFMDTTAKLVKKTFAYTGTDIEVDLLNRDRTVYLGVEVVLEDGRKSEINKIKITTTAADSDGDGIPDWYVDKYRLWPEDGATKDIANSDDDLDGLTNLQEYLRGSDPKNPNDPVHTTAIPVKDISISATSVNLNEGASKTVTASVTPSNATNKAITWSVDNSSIAKVSGNNNSCTITGLKGGKTVLRAVTKDGGYVASCSITVTHIHKWNSGVITVQPTSTSTGVKTYTCSGCGAKKTEVVAKLIYNAVSAKNISKVYSSKTQKFNIGAKASAGGKLTYRSNNSCISVDSNGLVTVKAKYIGQATISIIAPTVGQYKSSVSNITVTVTPTKTSIVKVTSPKKKYMKITWKKNKTAAGYQIYCSTSKSFNKNKYSRKVKGQKKVSFVSKGFKSKKTYYVKIRAYKKVNGKNIYGPWSKVKRCKVK